MTTAGSQVSISASGTSGATGATGPGAYGLWQPQDIGAVAWTMDPELAGTNVTYSAGVLYLARVKMSVDSTISKVGLSLRTTAPAGLANTFVGLYTQSGVTATLLASSSDLSSTMNAVATPTYFNLSSATALQTAGTSLLVAFLFGSATTAPTMIGNVAGPNRYIALKQNYRHIAFGSSQTALPATADLSSGSASDAGSVSAWTLSA